MYAGILQMYAAILRVYAGILQVYAAILRVYVGILQMYAEILTVHAAIFTQYAEFFTLRAEDLSENPKRRQVGALQRHCHGVLSPTSRALYQNGNVIPGWRA
jgi:hypothetical protein